MASNKIVMSFEDNILLKIKREFSRDEAVKVLQNELSKAKFKIGELESENAELQYLLSKPSKGKTAKEWQKDEYVQQLKILVKRVMKKRTEIQKDLVVWRNKYFSLAAKNN